MRYLNPYYRTCFVYTKKQLHVGISGNRLYPKFRILNLVVFKKTDILFKLTFDEIHRPKFENMVLKLFTASYQSLHQVLFLLFIKNV